MGVVWKYRLTTEDGGINVLSMPAGAQILHVGIPGGVVTMWVLVDVQAPPVARQFEFVWTGDAVPNGAKYLQTVFAPDGLVWHLFELTE